MKRDDIEKYIEKKQTVSDRNYMNYQATGTQRYLREHERAEDEIEIARQALSAADDHTKALEYKCELVEMAAKAEWALRDGTQQEYEKALKEMISIGKIAGYMSRWEEER